MNQEDATDKDDRPGPPGRREQVLDRLEAILTEQIHHAEAGRFDRVAESVEQLRILLANAIQPLAPNDPRKAARIARLYDRLRLVLAARKQGISVRLRELGQGDRLLGVYKKYTTY